MPETIAVEGMEAVVEDLFGDEWITAYGNRTRQDQMKNTAPRLVRNWTTALSKSLIMAAALTDKEAEQDSVYLNKTQNIIVISTPMIANAKAYAGVRKIHASL
ncbi:hypothetical protein HPB52_021692 [Rhipicephalus sanguineus]|uniref:Uncharacterized protein n=1 Tax=Rhipicephalus sanguineus TaxID=34632 RepID=A0A9D4Q8C3_RHISA|nr:hypothetical protein HPB52_021692 [Rhipicephalus sanguineus]